MDSDDLILQSWLNHSIEVMNSDKRCSLVGTNEMTFVYPHYDWKITGIRCPEKRMVHEAVWSILKSTTDQWEDLLLRHRVKVPK